jgi:hypothetical protein
MSMSREEVLANAIALRTMETHAALTARAFNSSTESKVTRQNYETYQKHFRVSFTET